MRFEAFPEIPQVGFAPGSDPALEPLIRVIGAVPQAIRASGKHGAQGRRPTLKDLYDSRFFRPRPPP
jgi:hypothetical protein